MRALTAGLATLAVLGCDPKLSDWTKQHQALIDDTKTKFGKVAALIAAAPLPALDATCKPPATLHQAHDGTHDTDVIGYQELVRAGEMTNSDREWDEIPVHCSSPLEAVLTDVHPTFAQYRKPDLSVNKLWQQRYTEAAQVKYVVVVRTRDIDRGGGRVVVDAHLVDWSGPKLLCALSQELRVEGGLDKEYYDVVQRNTKTGAEKVVRSDSHDQFWEALFRESDKMLEPRLKKELGVVIEDPR
jgi:hypothetical protein